MLSDSGQKELVKLAKSSRNESDHYSSNDSRSFAGCTATVALITP